MSQSAMPCVKKDWEDWNWKGGDKEDYLQAKRLAKRRAGNSQFHDINVFHVAKQMKREQMDLCVG